MRQLQEVDLLIHGASLVAFDSAGTEINDCAVTITGNSIVWIGEAKDTASLFAAKNSLDACGLIAIPGFVDAHFHTAQQFLHGKLAAVRRRGQLRERDVVALPHSVESGLEPEDIYCCLRLDDLNRHNLLP